MPKPRPPSHAVQVPPPEGLGRDTPRRRASREALVRVLWNRDGTRRLPSDRALRAAVEACDPRDVWWVCEANSAGPVYLLPTAQWVRALGRFLQRHKVRSVLEVGAGDGFLTVCLQRAFPSLRCTATDSHAWADAKARMNARDRRTFKGTTFQGIRAADHVQKLAAVAAVKRFKPDLVVVCWAPPGRMVEDVIEAPSRLVLDIGVDGDVCGNGAATWRFNKEFVEGPLEQQAWCRMDGRGVPRATRVTLYYGSRHAEFFEEDV